MVAVGIHVALRQQFLPAWLKYVSTGCDVVLLTAVVCVAAGPKSPLVAGYFVVLALAALRFSLPLVRCAAVSVVVAYLYVLGYAKWFAEADIRVPRYHQAIVLIGLMLVAVTLGQIIRRARSMAVDFARPANRSEEPVA